MDNISEYQQYLFLGKITGTLSESEATELQQLFENKPEAEKEYIDFISTLPKQDVVSAFKRVQQPAFWKNHLPKEIVRQRKRTRRRIITGVSAVAVLFVSLAIVYLRPFNVKTDKPISQNHVKAVQLKLSNGKVIDLNNYKGTITAEGISLDNKDGSLSYNETSSSNGINSVIVPVGLTYLVNLSDGSKVWLNSATQLDFPSAFTNNNREISIQGEAYIEVAKNKLKPFFVKLPKATVEVTGTSFNINTFDSLITKVSLLEGGLNLVATGNKIKVDPGNQGVYNASTQTLTSETFDSRKILSWREGLFYFDKASLDEIATVIYRWYGIQTIIDTKGLSNKRFAGILNKNEPIEVFMDDLKNITKIEVFIDQKHALHFK